MKYASTSIKYMLHMPKCIDMNIKIVFINVFSEGNEFIIHKLSEGLVCAENLEAKITVL